jgi:hypothetical protein
MISEINSFDFLYYLNSFLLMKVLITNPDAIIDQKTNKYYPGLLDVLQEFESHKDQGVIVISNSKSKFSQIEDDFYCLEVGGKGRAGRALIDLLQDKLKVPISDLFVLGCKQEDVGLAANNKLLLLRAEFTKEYFGDERIFENEYGIRIDDAKHLKLILNKFINIKEPWYFKCTVNHSTTIYSLTNANTMGVRPSEVIHIADEFRSLLKSGKESYKDEFMIYFLNSAHQIFKEFQTVNYWGVYPSSSVGENADLEYFAKKVRQSFGGRPCEPILIRHTASTKRHKLSTTMRETNGCSGEFATIKLNPYYQKNNKLLGKTVCIIDDFTNIGTSCETARHLLEMVGVAKLIFITMGKFGKVQLKYNYDMSGDPFDNYTFKLRDKSSLGGTFNPASDLEFIKSLGGLVK